MTDTPPETPVEPLPPEVVLGDAPQYAGSPWLIEDPDPEPDPEPNPDPEPEVPPDPPVDDPTTDEGDA